MEGNDEINHKKRNKKEIKGTDKGVKNKGK
jgi:hypothetical protein